MVYCAKAPLRIGLAGGGTDVSPFSDLHGGAILNATVNLYAHAVIVPRTDGQILFHAFDRKEQILVASAPKIPIDGVLDLQKGVYNRMVRQFTHEPLAFELTTYIDAPSGSGLGTSSTLVVAIIGAFVEWLKLPLGEYDIAKLAYEIEREDLAMAGGKQDQYAATFGGVNFMEFYADNKVIVNPLRIKPEILQELAFHLLLYYTKTSRESARIIEQQSENIKADNQNSIAATFHLKEQAYQMKEALLTNDLSQIGEILNFGWQNKKQMAKGISNAFIDEIYDTAISSGASGGKISGAGGGGFMLFYCPQNTKFAVMDVLNTQGGILQPYNFVEKGMISWTSNS